MLGKLLVVTGIALTVAGILIIFGVRLPWLGRLPGDILIHRKDVTIFIPLTTSIIISLVLSVIVFFMRHR